jgi:hypothetical protein
MEVKTKMTKSSMARDGNFYNTLALADHVAPSCSLNYKLPVTPYIIYSIILTYHNHRPNALPLPKSLTI